MSRGNMTPNSNKQWIMRMKFDNPQKAYFAGKHITGKVFVDLPKPMSTRGVYVTFKGVSQLCLNKGQKSVYPYVNIYYHQDQIVGLNVPRGHTIKSYESTDIYFDARQKVYGSDMECDDNEVTLTAGHHSFKFAFILPPKLPTSYEGLHGFIRYTCVALIRGTKRHRGITHLETITVLSIVDLNLMPNIELTQEKEQTKHMGFLFFKSGPITARLNLNKKGFVPGENILINGEIINRSNREILKTVITLCSLATFENSFEYKQYERRITKLEKGPIPQQVTQRWRNVHFKIPVTPPSKLGGCRFMDLEYCLLFSIITAGISTHFHIRFPIVIGTVPLRDQFDSFRPFRGRSELNSPEIPQLTPEALMENLMTFEPETPPPYSPLYDTYPDLPPPTYEECVQEGAVGPAEIRRAVSIKENDDESDEDEADEVGLVQEEASGSFAPRYSYYNQFGRMEDPHTSAQDELLLPMEARSLGSKNSEVAVSVENLSVSKSDTEPRFP